MTDWPHHVSRSYPFLSLSRLWQLPYSAVLVFADGENGRPRVLQNACRQIAIVLKERGCNEMEATTIVGNLIKEIDAVNELVRSGA